VVVENILPKFQSSQQRYSKLTSALTGDDGGG